jgi:hypothetical protein
MNHVSSPHITTLHITSLHFRSLHLFTLNPSWIPLLVTTFLTLLDVSNKSPTRYNNFPVYYPDVYLQLNMFRAFPCPSLGTQWLQWQPLVLPSYRGDSRAVFVVGPVNRLNVRLQAHCLSCYICIRSTYDSYSVRYLTMSNNGTSNNLPRMQNRRLLVRF